MKALIHDVRIDWMDRYGNDPTWYILLQNDETPRFFDFDQNGKCVKTWENKNGMWRAEEGDFVNFKAYSAPGDGYGGSVYPVILKSGERVELKGPWSSRAGCANRVFTNRDRCVEYSTPGEQTFAQRQEAWKRPYFGGLGGCAIKANALIEWLFDHDFMCQHLHLKKGSDAFRNPEFTITREKCRLAWFHEDKEPVLRPIDYLSGEPKNKVLDGSPMIEVR